MQLTQQQQPCTASLLRLNLISLLVLLASTSSTVTYASSPDAWIEFRKDVGKTCKEATSRFIKNPKVIVDPFGSQSYGLAIARGRSAYISKDKIEIICIYDKQSKKVEIGSELTIP